MNLLWTLALVMSPAQDDTEISSAILKKVFPDLVFRQKGNRKEPSSRSILAIRSEDGAKEFTVDSFADLKPHLKPAKSEEAMKQTAAALAQLLGTCRMCGFQDISPETFKVEKEGVLKGEFPDTISERTHVVYAWKATFDQNGALQTFESKSDYQTWHE